MAEVQVKGEIENIGRNVQHSLERLGIPILIKFFKKLFSTVYQQHIEGIQAIQNDGPTGETERITNLSYEEVQDVLTKCQQDRIKAVAYEFKKGNNEVEDEFGKSKSLSKMQTITKAQRKINQYKTFQKRYPDIYKKQIQKNISKWENIKEKAINKHEGYRYNVVVNKSRVGYLGERLIDIKNARLNIQDAISKDDPKISSVLDEIREKGFDLNNEQIRAFAGEFMSDGNIDVSEFKEDYIIHTIQSDEFYDMYKELKNSNIDYGVDIEKVFAASPISDEKSTKQLSQVKVYVKTEDIEEYNNIAHLHSGVIQSIGKKDIKLVNNQIVENKTITKTKEIELPREDLFKCMQQFKGQDYVICVKDKDKMILSINMNDARKVYKTEKKRNVVQDEIKKIEAEKAKEQKELNAEIEKEIDASPDTTNIEASDINIKDEIELGGND